jgi:hypothetical protein
METTCSSTTSPTMNLTLDWSKTRGSVLLVSKMKHVDRQNGHGLSLTHSFRTSCNELNLDSDILYTVDIMVILLG